MKENIIPKSIVTIDYLKKKNVPVEDTNKIHYHPYHEFLVVNKGFITYATDNGIIKVEGKSIIFMPAHTLHNPYVQNHPYERYRIKFHTEFADRIIKQPGLLRDALNFPYIKQLNQNDYDEIYSITESLYKLSDTDSENELDKLSKFAHLTMLITKGRNAISVPDTPNFSYIADVVEYIKENYHKPLTIQMLANSFFVSKSKLIYDFKNYCRISISEYVTMTRIEKAKECLLKGWSVAATSEACGFSTSSYFIKVFSQITGYTPLKFQMKYMKGI